MEYAVGKEKKLYFQVIYIVTNVRRFEIISFFQAP